MLCNKKKYEEQKYLDSQSAPDRPGRYIAEILSQFINGRTDLRFSGVTSKLPAPFVSAYAISTALKSPSALQHNNSVKSNAINNIKALQCETSTGRL
jgi:hypothetical protein